MARWFMRLAGFVFLICAAAPGVASTFTSSQSGNWNSSSTWGGAGVPGAGDTATINGGHVVTLDIPVTIATLTVNSGQINGTQPITVTAAFNWNSGTLAGSSNITIQSGATTTTTGAGTLDSRTFNNAGTLNITSTSYFYMQNNAPLVNNGTINFQGDGNIYLNGGSSVITNNGTIAKTGGSSISTINVPLSASSGSQFLVQAATFNVAAVTSTAASFNVSSGALLNFNTNNTRTFDSASTIDGAGSVQFASGTNTVNATYNVTGGTRNTGATTTINSITSTGDITANGGTLNLNSASTLTVPTVLMTGGTLAGTAPITLTGTAMTWTCNCCKSRNRTATAPSGHRGDRCKSAKVEITIIPPDAKFTASTVVDLAPNQFIQFNQLLKGAGFALGDDVYNARVTLRVIEGQGRITGYASVVDMLSGDPTFVPAQ